MWRGDFISVPMDSGDAWSYRAVDIQGEWIPNTNDSWVDVTWTPRQMMPLNPVIPVITKNDFVDFFNYFSNEQTFSV